MNFTFAIMYIKSISTYKSITCIAFGDVQLTVVYHFHQITATIERRIANTGDTIWNGHRDEPFAIFECSYSNLFHRLALICIWDHNIYTLASANAGDNVVCSIAT